jgi:hypothetical protein
VAEKETTTLEVVTEATAPEAEVETTAPAEDGSV